jgi:hypothetical protein
MTSTETTFQEAATVLTTDCLSELCPSLLDENIPGFKGAEVVFLDLPRVISLVMSDFKADLTLLIDFAINI